MGNHIEVKGRLLYTVKSVLNGVPYTREINSIPDAVQMRDYPKTIVATRVNINKNKSLFI